jgi:hypothetical protein
MCLVSIHDQDVDADRSSFPTIRIADMQNDWKLESIPIDPVIDTWMGPNGPLIYFDGGPISRTECMVNDSISTQLVFPSPGIASTSYHSNGTDLSTTIWLDYPFDLSEVDEKKSLPVSFTTSQNVSQGAYSVLVKYIENKTLNEAVEEHIERTNSSSEGFHLYSNESFSSKLRNDPAFKLVYGYKGNPASDICISCKEMDLLMLHNNKLYIFGYYVESVQFREFIPKVLEMISNTELKDSIKETESEDDPGMITHENSTYRIKMNYPSDWEKSESNTAASLYGDTIDEIVKFSKYSYYNGIKYLNSIISLFVDNSPVAVSPGEDLGLYAYLQGTIKSYSQIAGFKLLGQNITKLLDGRAAYYLNYSHVEGDTKLITTEYGTIIGDDKVYFIVYRVPWSDYATFAPIFDDMKKSLDINVTKLNYKNPFLEMKYDYNWAKDEGGTMIGYNENDTYSFVTFYSPVSEPYYVLKVYQMDIDYDYPYKPFEGGTFPYTVSYQANNGAYNPQWHSLVTDRSFHGNIERNLYNETKSKGFVEEEKGHVSFPLNMDSFSLPDQFYITFRIQDAFLKGGKMCILTDDTDFLPSPPPEFSVSFAPSSIKEMRRGDEENVEVRLQSNLTLPFDVTFSSTQKPLQIKFNPNNTTGITNGLTTSNLNIEIPDNLTEDRSYSIPIRADIQFRPTFNQGNKSFANLSKVSDYTVNVVPDLTLGEQLGGLWNDLGSAMAGFVTIVATLVGLAGVIGGWFIRKKKRENESNKDGQSHNSTSDKTRIQYCIKCRNELNPDRMAFCPSCGTPIKYTNESSST